MSATIKWQPVEGKSLSIGAPSSFMEALERHFGNRPWVFSDHQHGEMRAFGAGLDDKEMREAMELLAEAAYEHGEIRVWPEY